MNEETYAKLDNIAMEELNIKSIQRELCIADGEKLFLVINKNDTKYHFVWGDIQISDISERNLREKGLITNILNRK